MLGDEEMMDSFDNIFINNPDDILFKVTLYKVIPSIKLCIANAIIVTIPIWFKCSSWSFLSHFFSVCSWWWCGINKSKTIINKKPIMIGRFDTLEEALEARKLAEEKYYQEFSYKGGGK